MPRWICPNCSAAQTVPDSDPSLLVTCWKCGHAAKRPTAVPSAPASENSNAQDDREEQVSGAAKMLILVGSLGPIGVGVLALMTDNPAAGVYLLAVGFTIGVQAILVWPIYTMVDDTRAIRRLLEQQQMK